MPSTVIRQIGYEPDQRQLIIVFQSGRRYAYYDVPREIYSALRAASSRGAYFNERIRDRFRYARLDAEAQ
jgi:hypothetical protein